LISPKAELEKEMMSQSGRHLRLLTAGLMNFWRVLYLSANCGRSSWIPFGMSVAFAQATYKKTTAERSEQVEVKELSMEANRHVAKWRHAVTNAVRAPQISILPES
jgi:hypothetical protein